MKKNKEKPLHSVTNNVLYLLKDIKSSHKLLIYMLVIEGICSIITPVFGIYLPKLVIELLTQDSSIEKILLTLGVFTLFITGITALQSMSANGKYMEYNDMRFFYQRRLFLSTLDCDYPHIESSKGQTAYQKAFSSLSKGDWSGTSKMITAMVTIFISFFSFIIYSSIISLLNPLIVILLISLSLINFYSLKYAIKYEHKCKDEKSYIERKLRYIEYKAGDVTVGKDVRLYNMADWFLDLRKNILKEYIAINKKIKKRHLYSNIIEVTTILIRDGIAYGYLIWSVLNNNITIGNFILYFGAITGFSIFVNNFVNNINQVSSASLLVNDMRYFFENTHPPLPVNKEEKLSLKGTYTIEFRNVYFTYTNDQEYVLKDFNLIIEAGKKVALVGVNGAGKTTIVKLLCGFYTPTKGDIFINDINIAHFEKSDLFALFSAVFQDITILPFSVKENISLKVSEKTDDEKVKKSLRKAGLLKAINKYTDGIDSKMLKVLDENGIVLSGGQQQKLLMARAIYKDAPILVLDESTAALDPIAESETYQNFHKLSKNKTAIYISHRLASTRFCDFIAFINEGKVYESGSHQQLMELKGEYANMFAIQSHYYNEIDKEETNETKKDS